MEKKEVEGFLEKLTKITRKEGVVIETGKVYFKDPKDNKNIYSRQFVFNHHLKKYQLRDF